MVLSPLPSKRKIDLPLTRINVIVPHKVKGLNGIRIADASIMPTIPSANTNAPCIMVGEKAADLIKKGRL
jgi:choline dehydrogenase-like flavoprotein